MGVKTPQSWIDDVRFLGEEQYEVVQAVRRLVHEKLPAVTEEVKYGGLIFSSGMPVCGVFAYRHHVSVEFGEGAKIADPHGFLEGSGKFRRHLKLHRAKDIESRKLASYLPLALEAALGKDSAPST